MTEHHHPDPRAAEGILRRLSSVLDEASGPLRRLDLGRIATLTTRQQDLLDELGGSLPEPGVGGGGPDVALVDEVRRKLLRNRVFAVHVLDFAARLQDRMGREEAEGYAADGQTIANDAVGRLIRTSV